MNIHKFMKTPTVFTYIVSSNANFFFYSLPAIHIVINTISTLPARMIRTVRTIFCPPISRARMRTEIILLRFEIRDWTFKFFLAPFTYGFLPIKWAFSSSWTFLIACSRTIFLVIAHKTIKFFFANQTIKKAVR